MNIYLISTGEFFGSITGRSLRRLDEFIPTIQIELHLKGTPDFILINGKQSTYNQNNKAKTTTSYSSFS